MLQRRRRQPGDDGKLFSEGAFCLGKMSDLVIMTEIPFEMIAVLGTDQIARRQIGNPGFDLFDLCLQPLLLLLHF